MSPLAPSVIIAVAAAAAVSAFVTGTVISRRIRRKITYMLDALEDKETNFRFDEGSLMNRRLNRTLNRLRTLFEKERYEIIEKEAYYGSMLDHVKTGVVVIVSGGDASSAASRRRSNPGQILYTNRAAMDMLGISSLSHIRQLRNIDPALYEAFADASPSSDRKVGCYNERGRITVSLNVSEASIGGEDVRIVAFNDVSGEMEQYEEMSWNKLIRVLTHEIMNTVTPISSLSQTLSEDVSHADSPAKIAELKSGLETISASSRGLVRFVENYRKLTRVSEPLRKAFYLRDLVNKVFTLTGELAGECGASLSYSELSEDILLYADEGQISQILVNLIRNALQAEARNVVVAASIDASESVVVTVSNDGRPISKESQEQIFVPFFTTKSDGTGIGLSLSRQIMRLHNGSIQLTRSDAQGTVFTLVFR